MNIDTAKHMLKSYSGMTNKMTDNNGRPKLDQAIETILNELEKKDKVIDAMAVELYNYANLGMLNICPAEQENGNYNLELCKMSLAERNCCLCIEEYFYKKVEG